MIRRLFFFFLVSTIVFSCGRDEPEPDLLVCVEGEFVNDDGTLYYVTCPDPGRQLCTKSFKIRLEVFGLAPGSPVKNAKLTIRSITLSNITKVERIVGLHNQRFEVDVIHPSDIPTTHRVTFELPDKDCSVNDLEDQYTFEVDEPCGSKIDIKFFVDCEKSLVLNPTLPFCLPFVA